MFTLSDKQSKRTISILIVVQVSCVLFAGYFGGHAMLFCQPKDTGPDACQRTAEYIWNNRWSFRFVNVWLASFIASVVLAFLCPPRHRNFVVPVLVVSLPILGYFVFLLMLIAGV
jgi:hypothetical protein